MGVDFYNCNLCNETFCDAGNYYCCGGCTEYICEDCYPKQIKTYGHCKSEEMIEDYGEDITDACDGCSAATLEKRITEAEARLNNLKAQRKT